MPRSQALKSKNAPDDRGVRWNGVASELGRCRKELVELFEATFVVQGTHHFVGVGQVAVANRDHFRTVVALGDIQGQGHRDGDGHGDAACLSSVHVQMLVQQ